MTFDIVRTQNIDTRRGMAGHALRGNAWGRQPPLYGDMRGVMGRGGAWRGLAHQTSNMRLNVS